MLNDYGEEIIYEIPPSFQDDIGSLESKKDMSLRRKQAKLSTKRRISVRDDAKNTSDLKEKKSEIDPGNLDVELKRFLGSSDDLQATAATEPFKEKDTNGKSLHNSLDELNSNGIPIPIDVYKFDRIPIELEFQKKVKQKSSLTALVERKAELNNPLTAQYSAYVQYYIDSYNF
jgi:hypothetical protein